MIRKAITGDLERIYSLISSASKESKILPRTKEEIVSVIDCFYVYEKEGQVVGCCSLEIYNKKLAEIRSLVVDPSCRNQGIARELINACIKEAKEKNIYEILTITERVNLFERQGFANCLNNQTALFIKP